jgi:hypothetical protein
MLRSLRNVKHNFETSKYKVANMFLLQHIKIWVLNKS